MHTTEPRDLLQYEYLQRQESGYDLTSVDAMITARLADVSTTDDELATAYRALLGTDVSRDWHYQEPSDIDAIVASLPPALERRAVTDLDDKIHGGWLGRCAGCNLGKPVELGEYWTQQRIRSYLELAGAWPLRDYIPAMNPMPAGFELRECWPETTLGNINGSARDDDIDYTVLGLHLIEQHGTKLSPGDVAAEWLLRLPYMQTYTAERATYRNLINSVPVESAGELNNPYREWIGAQIRGDIFGYVNPGDPRSAALEAYQDAALSHRANGIYGEMWSAALTAAAFSAADAASAIRTSLEHIPPRSRLHEALQDVVGCFERELTWEQARAHIEQAYGRYNWVHTINNATLVAAGLLWGGGDFTTTIGLTVVGGWDTDSNGATAGSIAGILTGQRNIPRHWTEPLRNVVHSALAGFDRTEISALGNRTIAAIERRERR